MGYSILLQYTPPPNFPNLPEAIISRILEIYSLTNPTRTTLQFRTYRAPSPPRLLTTITSATPPPTHPSASASSRHPPSSRDDETAYLFLEARPPTSLTSTVGAGAVGGGDRAMDNDGFEIIDASTPTPLPTSDPASAAKPTTKRYRTLAVRPAASVLPMLHQLLSPFVLGLTKAARATASTTSATPIPTALPGTSVTLSSLTFPPTSHPNPPMILTLYSLSSTSSPCIFLEGEYTAAEGEVGEADEVLRGFLEGCLPELALGLGERKFFSWDGDGDADAENAGRGEERKGWEEGDEKDRRTMSILARCLREGGVI